MRIKDFQEPIFSFSTTCWQCMIVNLVRVSTKSSVLEVELGVPTTQISTFPFAYNESTSSIFEK